MKWQAVIGLEIHVQLKTKSKIFTGASTAFGAEPNTQACLVTLGLPGVLPVMNQEAALLAVRFGLAVDAEINRRSIFARKNYFYPDLPKGYQISQFEIPIVGKGHVDIETETGKKTIRITRAHLEEDAGKSLHEDFHGMSGIDLNRAGTPLLEIVSEPDMNSAHEAATYLRKIHALVRYLDISDGNMQEGSFRCDANISIRPEGDEKLGTRAELKNINSFKFIEKAINYEIARQQQILESGGTVVQETRLYDADLNQTRSMRSKEDAHDYRYFPDPDLPDLVIDEAVIEQVRANLPELPEQRLARYIDELNLPVQDAEKLTIDKHLGDYFDATLSVTKAPAKIIANWLLSDYAAQLNQHEIEIAQSPINATRFAELLDFIADDTISGKIAKNVFQAMWQDDQSAAEIIEQQGLKQITDDSAIEALVQSVLDAHPEQVEQFNQGNEKIVGFLVGKVMQQSQGKANPKQVNVMLKKLLKG